MSEFLKTLETLGGVTVEQVLAFAALILPGFISLRVYEMRRGGEARKTSEVLLDLVVYSLVTDVAAFAALWLVAVIVPDRLQPFLKVSVWALAILVLPVAVAFMFFELRRRMLSLGLSRDPTAKPWDRFFERVGRFDGTFGAILTMRDGRKIGVRLIDPSYASSYPAPEQALFGEVWTIDPERARFVRPVPGSCGVLVDKADCETIEFLRWTEVDPLPARETKEQPK
ncbi:MAG: hypothetical protein JO083_06805 [Candidatus Eremiobacteraeota bacterium]|nr:hypothetical protein [Candidatus Eremiobacteraeota bacterium]